MFDFDVITGPGPLAAMAAKEAARKPAPDAAKSPVPPEAGRTPPVAPTARES
jgi:hypothetical protein